MPCCILGKLNVSGKMQRGVVLSYTLPEWDGASVLSFLSCSLMTVLVITPGSLPSRLADLTSACLSSTPPPVPLCWLVCLSVCMWLRLDFEGLENGEDGFLDKSKSWSRSIEDLHHSSTQPFCNTLVRSARQSVLRYVLLKLSPLLPIPRSANLQCYKHVLACKPVASVLLCFRTMPEWLISDLS